MHHPLRQKSPERQTSASRSLKSSSAFVHSSSQHTLSRAYHETPSREKSPLMREICIEELQRSTAERPIQNCGYGNRIEQSPLRSSGSKQLSRGGFLTTDPRHRVSGLVEHGGPASAPRADTDLYYSTDKSSAGLGASDLHEQAMTIVRHKKKSSLMN